MIGQPVYATRTPAGYEGWIVSKVQLLFCRGGVSFGGGYFQLEGVCISFGGYHFQEEGSTSAGGGGMQTGSRGCMWTGAG